MTQTFSWNKRGVTKVFPILQRKYLIQRCLPGQFLGLATAPVFNLIGDCPAFCKDIYCFWHDFSVFIYLSQQARRGGSQLQQGVASDLGERKICCCKIYIIQSHLFPLRTCSFDPCIKQTLVKLEIQRTSSFVLNIEKEIECFRYNKKYLPLMNMLIFLILGTCFQKTVFLLNMTRVAAALILQNLKKMRKIFAI